ncbi:MAG TPA: hypothetical protein VF037_07675, partial [Gemmatimonadales bacterium]
RPAAVAAGFEGTVHAIHAADRYRALLALRTFAHARSVHLFGEVLHYTDRRSAATAAVASELEAFLRGAGISATARPVAPTIEDTFIQRMGAPEAA